MGRIFLKTYKQQIQMSFFNMRYPTFNDFDVFTPSRVNNNTCCNDPYCQNNKPYDFNQRRAQKPRRNTLFNSMFDDRFDNFGQTFERDPLFNSGFASNLFGDEILSNTNQNRKIRNVRTKPQTAQAQRRKTYINKNDDYLRKSTAQEEQFDNKENVAPKFYSTMFNSNSVSKNGQTTTINKRQYKDENKSETFVTKITEDKDGNRNVKNLNPKFYNSELKAIIEEMEERGAVLMEVNPPVQNDEAKMLEEERTNDLRSISSDRISNTDSGNNMF